MDKHAYMLGYLNKEGMEKQSELISGALALLGLGMGAYGTYKDAKKAAKAFKEGDTRQGLKSTGWATLSAAGALMGAQSAAQTLGHTAKFIRISSNLRGKAAAAKAAADIALKAGDMAGHAAQMAKAQKFTAMATNLAKRAKNIRQGMMTTQRMMNAYNIQNQIAQAAGNTVEGAKAKAAADVLRQQITSRMGSLAPVMQQAASPTLTPDVAVQHFRKLVELSRNTSGPERRAALAAAKELIPYTNKGDLSVLGDLRPLMTGRITSTLARPFAATGQAITRSIPQPVKRAYSATRGAAAKVNLAGDQAIAAALPGKLSRLGKIGPRGVAFEKWYNTTLPGKAALAIGAYPMAHMMVEHAAPYYLGPREAPAKAASAAQTAQRMPSDEDIAWWMQNYGNIPEEQLYALRQRQMEA